MKIVINVIYSAIDQTFTRKEGIKSLKHGVLGT